MKDEGSVKSVPENLELIADKVLNVQRYGLMPFAQLWRGQ